MRRFGAPVALVLCCPGCAAIISGTSERLVLSSAEPETHFYVDGREVGFGTSAIATVPKKELGRVVLQGKKDDCGDAFTTVETTFDPVTLVGCLLDGGLISILVVDGLATGAWQKAAYREFMLTPRCD